MPNRPPRSHAPHPEQRGPRCAESNPRGPIVAEGFTCGHCKRLLVRDAKPKRAPVPGIAGYAPSPTGR